MFKILPPGTQDLGGQRVQHVKLASCRHRRRRDARLLSKRADPRIVRILSELTAAPGEELAHVFALGSTPGYGFNRNGDGFPDEACRRYHHTFVKHARVYRDHRNRDPSKSYGLVKYSFFNEEMKRIELVVALNATKAAAERNGGLIADRELEKLASGQDVCMSMSCKVPYDRCSICQKLSSTREEYCDGTEYGGTCEGGGAKRHLGVVLEDGRQLGVENDHPTFIDISHVVRNADRIAYMLGFLKSAAARGEVVGGAALAEAAGMLPPDDLPGKPASFTGVMDVLHRLAGLERSLQDENDAWRLAFRLSSPVTIELPQAPLADVLAALSGQKVVLPIHAFMKASGHETPATRSLAQAAAARMRGVYGRILRDMDAATVVDLVSRYCVTPRLDGPLCKWARSLRPALSVHRKDAQRRVHRAAVRGLSALPDSEVHGRGSDDLTAEAVARAYALYKLAFLLTARPSDRDFDLTCRLVLRQNEA